MTAWRVANGWDIIPNFPPAVYWDADTQYNYFQVGTLVPVDGGFTVDPATAHSLTSYAFGLNTVILGHPPSKNTASRLQIRRSAPPLRSRAPKPNEPLVRA